MRPTESADDYYVLKTPLGSLRGIEKRDEGGKPILYRFTKIPYALPPVGPLRWRRPQPLPRTFTFDNASGTPGDYTEFGAICPQPQYAHTGVHLDNQHAAPPIVNYQDEDCLYLNIWIPAGSPPKGGWPVQFQLHGGWLQVGNAMQGNDHDPFDLLAYTTPRIIVSPTYRLNLFGFLAGADLDSLGEEEAPSNFGFWDQRAALEWTAKHVPLFGGDASNITVGGLSAGANSTFFQLYYDSHLPASQRLIRRIYLWSNAVAIQPNNSNSAALTSQFNELCTVLNIPSSGSASEKVSRLRAVPSADLVAAISRLKMHTFRASTDNAFIPATFLSSLHSGSFTTLLSQSNVSVMLGEVCDERELYKMVNPPSNHPDLLTQLTNYYPKPVVDALLPLYPVPRPSYPNKDSWANVFSDIVADGQVHASIRGLTHILLNPPKKPGVVALPGKNVHRYRISWRAKGLDAWIQPSAGVCHGADMPIWWASGWRADFTDADKTATKKFLEPFGQFLYGKEVNWGASAGDERKLRWFDQHGNVVENVEDELWDRGMEVWNAVWEAQKGSVARDTSLDSRL